MGACERSAILVAEARYSPFCVTGNIRNTPYEMNDGISKEVQAATNIRYQLARFRCLSWLFPLNQENSLISQCTGKEMRNLLKVILPCFAASYVVQMLQKVLYLLKL